jgi:hypothetical protein
MDAAGEHFSVITEHQFLRIYIYALHLHLDKTSAKYDSEICTQRNIRRFQLITGWPTIHLPLFFNWYADNANIKLKFFIVIQKSKS